MATSIFWAATQDFLQIDGLGRAYEVRAGVQGSTREARADGFEALAVGEFDMVAAFYKIFLLEIKKLIDGDIEDTVYAIVVHAEEHPQIWRAKIIQSRKQKIS